MPTPYSDLVHLFVDLRGQGLSLSAMDFDILLGWEKNNLSVDLIAKIMVETSEECKEKNTHFPNSLAPISRKLNQVLLKMRES